MRRAAAVVSMLAGLGFGIPCAVAIWYFARTGQVWTFMGFPTYGDGPFERIGIPTSIPLLVGFLAVCAGEVVLAVLLWRGTPGSMALGFVLLPFEFAFWIGFSLPFGPLFGIVRTALVVLSSGQLRRLSPRRPSSDAHEVRIAPRGE